VDDQYGAIVTIAVMASIVYLTRVSGYFIGLQFRHIGRLRPVLEALPGCAIMAILTPAIRQGSSTDIVALLCVLGIMWITDNVVLATVIGLAVLMLGESVLGTFY
jgi:uncharacterized membrane protein